MSLWCKWQEITGRMCQEFRECSVFILLFASYMELEEVALNMDKIGNMLLDI